MISCISIFCFSARASASCVSPTEEQFVGGLTVCGADAGSNKGQTLPKNVKQTTVVNNPTSDDDVIINNV